MSVAITVSPSPEAIASVTSLYNNLQAKAQPLVDRFEVRYTAWKQTWDSSVDQEVEFARLADMGVKILPLVVYKLCNETETRAVELYNAIEKKENFKSQSPSAIITSNYQRNREFDESAADWQTYKDDLMVSHARAYTGCGAWYELIELGAGIVTHAMLAYYDDLGGWWDELLCELISGHGSGAWVLYRQDIQRRWIDWFENKEGEAEAPYKLVGEAANLERSMRAQGAVRYYVEFADEDNNGLR